MKNEGGACNVKVISSQLVAVQAAPSLSCNDKADQKEYPDWLRALTPRHTNVPADSWPQKVLALSSANAMMQNYVSTHERRTRPNPALAVVHCQAALLLRYDVPTNYISRELLAAVLRTGACR